MLCIPSLPTPTHSLWHPFWEEISMFPKPSGVCWAVALWTFSPRTLPFELLFVSLQMSLSLDFTEYPQGRKIIIELRSRERCCFLLSAWSPFNISSGYNNPTWGELLPFPPSSHSTWLQMLITVNYHRCHHALSHRGGHVTKLWLAHHAWSKDGHVTHARPMESFSELWREEFPLPFEEANLMQSLARTSCSHHCSQKCFWKREYMANQQREAKWEQT